MRNHITLVTIILSVFCSAPAFAEVFYVAPGGDDAGPGSRTAPFGSPAGCFAAMSSGDTCLLETGRWEGRAPDRYVPYWNVCDGPSGSPSAPTIYAAAPGATPELESFGGYGGCEHIVIENVRTTESFLIWSVSNFRVTGCEMSGGMDMDGNWSAVRVEDVESLTFDHNYVTGLNDCPGCREQALVTVFTTSDSVFEFNTLSADEGVSPQYGALMLKDSPINVDVRYNLILGHKILCSNQNGRGREGRDLRIYGNVVIRGSIQSWVRTLDTSIHHNTIIQGALIADGSHSPGLEMVANLVAGTTYNVVFDEEYWDGLSEIFLDNNVYDSGGAYVADRYGPTERSLTDLPSWRSALQADGCAGCEESSQELDCEFVAGEDTDYHLAGGACATAGLEGHEVGAYALTHCVGHLCGEDDEPDETPDEEEVPDGGPSDGGPDDAGPGDAGYEDDGGATDAGVPEDASDPEDSASPDDSGDTPDSDQPAEERPEIETGGDECSSAIGGCTIARGREPRGGLWRALADLLLVR